MLNTRPEAPGQRRHTPRTGMVGTHWLYYSAKTKRVFPHYLPSRTTSRGSLSSRKPTKADCRRCASGVHSANSMLARPPRASPMCSFSSLPSSKPTACACALADSQMDRWRFLVLLSSGCYARRFHPISSAPSFIRRPSLAEATPGFSSTHVRLTARRFGDIARVRKKGGLNFLGAASRAASLGR